MKLRTFGYCALLSFVVAGFSIPVVSAAEDKEKSTDKSKTEESADEKKEAEEPSPPSYELPKEATIEEMEAFIEQLSSYRPKKREAMIAHARKMRTVMSKANSAMLELLEDAGETDTPRYIGLKRNVVSSKLSGLMGKSADETMNEIVSFLEMVGEDLGPEDGRIGVMAGYYLSNNKSIEADTKTAFLERVTELLNASEETSGDAEKLEGIVRRANLIGNKLELSGTKLNGDKFDIQDLKGKVVLVDFWATWCGPCVAEHPNIEKNYELFHDKGFEVVGLSLDRDRERLETFVEEHETKWIVLHDDGGKNDATTYYGVIGIPSMFLLDQEGKVVSTTARGKQLGEKLTELLGEPEVAEAVPTAEESTEAESETSSDS